MAGCALFGTFAGAFSKIFMAADTSHMKCIRAFHEFEIFNFRDVVAIQAVLRRFFPLFRDLMAGFTSQGFVLVFLRVMMALITGETIACFRCMGLMSEQNIS